jgi:AraC-like DNA-binding protein
MNTRKLLILRGRDFTLCPDPHFFTKQVGLPPHVYLNQVRVNRAKQLLADGQPIALVAYETGFADQSHLTRHFKRLFGLTLGQYSMRQERSRHLPD